MNESSPREASRLPRPKGNQKEQRKLIFLLKRTRKKIPAAQRINAGTRKAFLLSPIAPNVASIVQIVRKPEKARVPGKVIFQPKVQERKRKRPKGWKKIDDSLISAPK